MNMRTPSRTSLGLALALVFLLVAASVSAQQVSQPKPGSTGSWRYLGTSKANHSADHDIMIIKGPYDYFRRLKFKVTNSPLNMQRMVVKYDDGGLPEKIETRFTIPKGGESRIIDLKGGKRKLKSVEYWYDTKGIFNGRADVTLMGIK
jgi:hypothetical protein